MDKTDVNMLRDQLAGWRQGIAEEQRFWSNWLATKGARWPDRFQVRFDPTARLRGDIAKIVQSMGKRRLRILDVGAGPVTNIGFTLPGFDLDITAVDPLSPVYAALLHLHGLTPPVPTAFAPAEDLSAFFDEGSFDFVHCTNALDHSMDPIRDLREMLQVMAIGGTIYLSHHEDEAVAENYIGFHQHNFTVRDGRFVIWNRDREIDVAAEFGDAATVEAKLEPAVPPPGTRASVRVLIRKHASLPPTANGGHRQRLAHLLEAVVDLMASEG